MCLSILSSSSYSSVSTSSSSSLSGKSPFSSVMALSKLSTLRGHQFCDLSSILYSACAGVRVLFRCSAHYWNACEQPCVNCLWSARRSVQYCLRCMGRLEDALWSTWWSVLRYVSFQVNWAIVCWYEEVEYDRDLLSACTTLWWGCCYPNVVHCSYSCFLLSGMYISPRASIICQVVLYSNFVYVRMGEGYLR